MLILFFFFKQKTAYEMRISDWSSDVCSSDLPEADDEPPQGSDEGAHAGGLMQACSCRRAHVVVMRADSCKAWSRARASASRSASSEAAGAAGSAARVPSTRAGNDRADREDTRLKPSH